MSIVISRDIFCDGEDCDLWTEGTTQGGARDARKIAARRGWKYLRRRDLCPACAAKEPEKGGPDA